MRRATCGTAILETRCDRCGGLATARYVDDGRRLTATVRCTGCGEVARVDYAPGYAAEGATRAALLAQSGRWRLHLLTLPGRRRDTIAAVRSELAWSLDRLAAAPRDGDLLVYDGTYGECNHAARRLEALGLVVRLEHVSGDTSGLIYPPTEAELLAQRQARAARDASFTPHRCPHCGAPCPSYRRTCKACLRPV